MAAERNRYAHGHTIRVISRAGGKTATEPIKTPSMWVGRARTKGSILPSICRRHTADGIKGLGSGAIWFPQAHVIALMLLSLIGLTQGNGFLPTDMRTTLEVADC